MMTVTAARWNTLPRLSQSSSFLHGSCRCNHAEGIADCVSPQGKRSRFALQDVLPLEETVAASLTVQFALLESLFGNQAKKIVVPNMEDPEIFDILISQFARCYDSFDLCYRSKKLHHMSGHRVSPEAKDAFYRLLAAGRLHPCIAFLGAHIPKEGVPGLRDTLYELHDLNRSSEEIPHAIQDFAAFLKRRQKLLELPACFPCFGYTQEEWMQSALLTDLLSLFSRAFYIEDERTRFSVGFLLQ